MSKKVRQTIERGNAAYEQRSLAAGDRFRLSWHNGSGGSCLYFPSEAAAAAKRDALLKEHAIEIPQDYYARQASLVTLELEIHEHDGIRWRLVEGSRRSCPKKVRWGGLTPYE
ncbi:MAG: hypothetical protein K8H88_31340 [Sandaracinaceae bacterium]|nr:hypothetical protein [Sandaracinaceae bacterium]